MPDADTRQRRALCPRCSKAMRYLGAATEVVPFWQRVGAFFRYPFHTDPLIVIAICTLVPLIAPPNLIGLLIWIVLALALFKYTYAVINHTAEGHLKPPPVAVAFTGSGFNIVILQLLVFVLMGGLVGAAAMIGGPILMMLTLASGAAQDFAVNHFPMWVAQPLAGFLNSTFTLILFHMLGYLLFQYQEELGFASDLQDGEGITENHQRDRSSRFDADLDMNLKDGNYDRVHSMLLDALKNDRDNPVRIGQLYQLLTARNDTRELYRFHPRIMAWLAARQDGDGLNRLVETLQTLEPGFKLEDPELAVTCATTLYHRGHPKTAIRLLQDFHKRFPNSDQLAPAYLIVAQALANGLQQWEKASAFLAFIQKRCAGHPVHQDIEVWLEQARNHQPLKGPKASFQVPD